MKTPLRGGEVRRERRWTPIATVGWVMREEEHSTVNSKWFYILISLRKIYFSSIIFQNECSICKADN